MLDLYKFVIVYDIMRFVSFVSGTFMTEWFKVNDMDHSMSNCLGLNPTWADPNVRILFVYGRWIFSGYSSLFHQCLRMLVVVQEQCIWLLIILSVYYMSHFSFMPHVHIYGRTIH